MFETKSSKTVGPMSALTELVHNAVGRSGDCDPDCTTMREFASCAVARLPCRTTENNSEFGSEVAIRETTRITSSSIRTRKSDPDGNALP